jgi:hypothetical protein
MTRLDHRATFQPKTRETAWSGTFRTRARDGVGFEVVNSMSEGEIFAMLRQAERKLEGGATAGRSANGATAMASRDKQNPLDSANRLSDDEPNDAKGKAYGIGHKILTTRIARLGIPGIDADNGRIARVVLEKQQKTGPGERSGSDVPIADREAESRSEQAKLIATAKKHGLLFDENSPLVDAIRAHENRGGTEHDAYFVGKAPNIVVIRSTTNSGFGLTSGPSPTAKHFRPSGTQALVRSKYAPG